MDKFTFVNAVRDSTLTSEAKLILVMLSSRDGPYGLFPSMEQIAKDTSLSRSTVVRYIKYLEMRDWMDIERRAYKPNRYFLKCPGDTPYSVTLAPGIVSSRHSNSKVNTKRNINVPFRQVATADGCIGCEYAGWCTEHSPESDSAF